MQCKNARYYYLRGNYTHGGTSVGFKGLILEPVSALLTIREECGWEAGDPWPRRGCSSPRTGCPLDSSLFSLLRDGLPFSTCSQSGVPLPDSDRTTLPILTVAVRESFVTSEPQFPHMWVLTYLLFRALRKYKMLINCNVKFTFSTETYFVHWFGLIFQNCNLPELQYQN